MIYIYIYIYICGEQNIVFVLDSCIYIYIYSLLPLRSVVGSNFDKGLDNLKTLMKKKD